MTNDEVEKAAKELEILDPYTAALIRRLRDERDQALRNGTDKATAWDAVAKARVEARNKALDEANAVVQKARFGEIDSDLRSISSAILALKTPQEPKP